MSVTDPATTVNVLARIVRGDTHKEISTDLNIPITTIASIKKRNQSALATMQERLLTHQMSQSKRILDKSHTLINKRLDRAIDDADTRADLDRKLQEGKISSEDYYKLTSALYEPSLNDLNAISREAFNQSTKDSDGSASLNEGEAETKRQLVTLVEALNNGDEVELQRIIINKEQQA